MKFRNPETGEVFEDIERARTSYCSGKDCDHDCEIAFKRTTCSQWAKDHPAEAARLMGLEVVEEPAMGETQGGKSLFCEHIGVAPSQPFIVHGYPYRNYPPMVYGEDGCVRLYAPDGQKRHKVGGRAITWIVDHPESVEPCEGYTPQEAAFKKEEKLMEKQDKPRFTEEEVEDAKNIMRFFQTAYSIERYKDSTLGVRSREQFLTNITNSLFPSLRPGQTVRLEEVMIDGK